MGMLIDGFVWEGGASTGAIYATFRALPKGAQASSSTLKLCTGWGVGGVGEKKLHGAWGGGEGRVHK